MLRMAKGQPMAATSHERMEKKKGGKNETSVQD